MNSEKAEQEMMSLIMKLAKKNGQRDKLGSVILYTFNESKLRDFAFDILEEIDIQ